MTEEKQDGGVPGSKLRAHVGELMLGLMVVAVVVMMIVPLTRWLMDLLIGVNICLSLMVVTLALFLRRPLTFSAFPTVLLVATLYRLSLNVASTRLILTQADAGRIIGAFGGFVVGGDILVGAVIFGILAMVLFLVITKGAERVAEVAARFTLDALPGMQLAIETDLKSGAISAGELTRRRTELENKSHYYGSLDGAMKFVRGDAIAALAIVGVNIVGGVAIGTLRHGMGITEALDTYGRLTVGDGLVTMIPALLISTAAGLLVTRVSTGDGQGRLGEQIGRQLTAEPRALIAAAALMLVLAVIPGLPAWPFAVLGAALAGGGVIALVRERRANTGRKPSSGAPDRIGGSTSMGLDEVQGLIDKLARSHPVLVRECVPKIVSLPVLTDMLSAMLEDGLSRDDLPDLLEAVVREPTGVDAWELLERARKRMTSLITRQVLSDSDKLEVAVLDDEVEAILCTGLTTSSRGPRLALPTEIMESIAAACDEALSSRTGLTVLVRPDCRRVLSELLRSRDLSAFVVAHGEIEPHVKVVVDRTIKLPT